MRGVSMTCASPYIHSLIIKDEHAFLCFSSAYFTAKTVGSPCLLMLCVTLIVSYFSKLNQNMKCECG